MTSERLLDLYFWDHLTENEQQRILTYSNVSKLKKGTVYYGYSDEILNKFVLLKGKIRVFVISPEGREITLVYLKPGDYNASCISYLIHRTEFDVVIECEENCELLGVPATILTELMDNNLQFRCDIYMLYAKRASFIMTALSTTLTTRVDYRLAKYLLHEMKKNNSNTITISNTEIARKINSVREVVSRTLRRFKEEDVVKLDKGKIVLLDIHALQTLSIA